MIQLEGTTHRILTDASDRDAETHLLLTASASAYEDARDEVYAKAADGYRLT